MTHRQFTIGVLSDQTGVNTETIRYYERISIMPPPPRSAGGRRLYGRADAKRLAFIRRGRELGFSIEDIRALLTADGEGACADVYEMTQRHLRAVRAKIADLKQMECALSQTADRCARDGSSECAVIDALAAD